MIVVIAMGAMRLGSRSVAAGEKKMDDQERFRTVLSLIDAQIQSQLPLTYEEAGNRKYYFRGDGKTLRFSTSYSIWSGRKGYVIVDYRVEADDSGREVLSASEQIPGIDGQWRHPFVGGKRDILRLLLQRPDRGDRESGWSCCPRGPSSPKRYGFT